MKKIFLFMIIIGFLANNAHAINIAKQWDKTYGNSGPDRGSRLKQTTDGGYIMTAWSSGTILVMKLNGNADITWQKRYGYGNINDAFSIQQTTDGGYMVAGFCVISTSLYALLMKLDSSGNITWQKGYEGIECFYSAQQTTDGGYIACDERGYGDNSTNVLKLDSNGDVSWQKKCYPDHRLSCIQQTADGGYIACGNDWYGNPYVLKLAHNGDVVWQKTYKCGITGKFIQQTTDGGYIVVSVFKHDTVDHDILIFKLDSEGNALWGKAYGGEGGEGSSYVQQTTDGNYIVAGSTDSFGAGLYDLWLFKIDSIGDIIWQKSYGGPLRDGDRGSYIQQTIDGGYIAVSSTASFGVGDDDSWVIKLNSDGEIPGCEVTSNTNARVSDIPIITQEGNAIIESFSVTPIDPAMNIEDTSLETTVVCQYDDPGDTDADGVSSIPGGGGGSGYISGGKFLADEDNCPEVPNGPFLGVCTRETGNIVVGTGKTCIVDEACGIGETCDMNQGDFNENGIGDACECHADFDNDGCVYPSDISVFLGEYGRTDCITNPPCEADVDGDGNVYPSDLSIFLEEYGKEDCPIIP